MSIRASGSALKEGGRVVTREGLPVLGALLARKSVDVVTEPGAGGMILTESAKAAPKEKEDDMSDEEKKELREAARLVREGRARQVAALAISDVSLIEAAKQRVIETCIRNLPMTAAGTLDEAKLTEAVKAGAKAEGEYLATIMPQGVRGMGGAPVVQQLSEADRTRRVEEEKSFREAGVSIFSDLMGDPNAAKFAAVGR
jgi:hypothetical protein